jgi:hypothetical protein
MKRISFLLLMAFWAVFTVKAQTKIDSTAQIWHIATTDGNDYYGEKISEDSLSLVLRTTGLGSISIPKSTIKTMQSITNDQLLNGSYLIPNAHSSRYFWSPNGFGLKRGEGYYQNTWVLLNQVSLGISNEFTIGVGVIPLFLFGNNAQTPFWITPKVQFPLDKKHRLNGGFGVIYMNIVGGNSRNSFGGAGIGYGVLTTGDRNKNFTLGLGYGFADGEFAKTPTVTISGMYRLGKRGYFLTENWFVSSGNEKLLFLSIGGRYTAKVLAFDYGLVRPFYFNSSFDYDIGLFAIPWLGINVPFGKVEKK